MGIEWVLKFNYTLSEWKYSISEVMGVSWPYIPIVSAV